MATGAEALCRAFAQHGVRHVFGLPGSQAIDLWEALRRSGELSPVVATHELAASFMANGHARATGRPAVLMTIPGPGFTYALTGLAEALLDSVPLVHVAVAPAERADGGYALQAIRQAEIARPLVKRVVEVASGGEVERAVEEALAAAAAGEPGPVLVQVPEAVLRGPAGRPAGIGVTHEEPPAGEQLDEAVERVLAARRPLLLCGSGAAGAAAALRTIAEKLSAPVLTTTSGRGVVPETHRCSLPFDSPGASPAVVNRLVESCDLVLAAGAKLSHNGSLGFALRLPQERLVRVDTSPQVMEAAYPSSLQVVADAAGFFGSLERRLADAPHGATWTDEELATWRAELAAAARVLEPRLAGGAAGDFVRALRAALPDDAIVSTDSGLHQYLVRRHLQVLAPRTLLVPTDLQSMGFGVPAAIGAAVATGRRAVAVVGDGGFAISGLELATAAGLGLPLTVIVLVDRAFGLIRLQQLRRTGYESGVDLPPLDLEQAAAAVSAAYVRLEGGDAAATLREAVERPGVSVVDVPVEQIPASARVRARGLALSSARTLLGERAAERLTDAARRRRGGA